MIDQNIVHEIDRTLDQLIRNAEAISGVDLQALSEIELEAFQKTQESLLQHLLGLDQIMIRKTPSLLDARTAFARIQSKRSRFQSLASEYTPKITEQQECRSILSKRRKKRFFDPRYSQSKRFIPK